jgi:hypothetical protein
VARRVGVSVGRRLLAASVVRDRGRYRCWPRRPTAGFEPARDHNVPALPGVESGWRGFALPKLQRHMSALSAALIVTLFWVGWHLPRFFYYGAYMELGFSVLPVAAYGFLALAIVLTWLYNSTRGSILMAALFHAGYSFWAASGAAGGLVTSTIDALLIIWAVVVVLVFGPANLFRKEKQML